MADAFAIASAEAPAGGAAGTNSMRTVVARDSHGLLVGEESSLPIVPTLVFDSGDQAPIECGCLRA